MLIEAVDSIRETVSDAAPDGLEVKVTGPAGYSADASAAFEGINSTLLFATALLVFVLLVIIYRSPIFWVFPLLAVFMAEGLVRGIGYGPRRRGRRRERSDRRHLLVLVFGAGTDYALLLTARYREELHRHEDKHEAMRVAVRQAGPGILARRAQSSRRCCASRSRPSTRRPDWPDRGDGRGGGRDGDAHASCRPSC